MKKCSKCGEVKPVDAFYKCASRNNVPHGHCKACLASYRAANRDKINEYGKAYRADNIGKERDRGRAKAKHNSDTLSDGHIKHVLIRNTTLRPADIPDWLVEAKREQLRLKRELRK